MINLRSLGAALFVVLTVSVRSEAQVSEPPGLIGLWAAEGNAADSASTNNGTLRGNVTYASGAAGQAFLFDGSGGYVEIANSLYQREQSTLMAWIRLDALPSATGNNYIARRSAGANDYDLEVETDNRVRFYPCGGAGGGGYPGSTTILQSEVWYHVAAIYKGAETMDLYINGTNEVSFPIQCILGENSAPFTIGFSPLWGRPFHGRIDQVRIYNRALTATEVQNVYAIESGAVIPSPVLGIRVSQVELCFKTVPGPWYQFQYLSALTSDTWVPVVTNLFKGDGGILCQTDAIYPGEPRKFYRVIITEAPAVFSP